MSAKKKVTELVVTNYDNFKNADFFIKQYFQAQKMLKEVDAFFSSFALSKLITSEDLYKINPSLLCRNDFTWTQRFIDYYTLDKGYDFIEEARLQGKEINDSDFYKSHIEKNKSINFKKNVKEICEKISNIIKGKFACYYITDQYNILHEFIPIGSSNTIKTDFNKKEIIISGHFYEYLEGGAQFGRSFSEMKKVIKKIIIDPNTNNVIDVINDSETVSEGNANGKSYWDHHEHYCLTSLTGKNKLSTSSWDNVRAAMINYRKWIFDTHHQPRDIIKFKEKLYEQFGERWKNAYNEDLTDDILKHYFNIDGK